MLQKYRTGILPRHALKKYTGKTTQKYIHLKLIEKAKDLLSGSGRTISEIAYELGFEHPSHFTKIFKARTGISPKSFRRSKELISQELLRRCR